MTVKRFFESGAKKLGAERRTIKRLHLREKGGAIAAVESIKDFKRQKQIARAAGGLFFCSESPAIILVQISRKM